MTEYHKIRYDYSEYPEDQKFSKKEIEDGERYRKIMGIEPEKLIGKEYDFFGAHSNCFKLDSIIFEVLENPDDGYRSYYDMLIIPPEQNTECFFDIPIARVRIEELKTKFCEIDNHSQFLSFSAKYEDEGFCLIDAEDNHIWLAFGTDYSDDYYPCFTFWYNPKKPAEGE